ncbi:unnamed protein product, partial [Discosporangium mesarthrocarpum]
DWFWLNVCIDVLFLLDFLGAFVTAYRDEKTGALIDKPSQIAKHYWKGFLLADLVAALPMTLVGDYPSRRTSFSVANKTARLLRLPRSLRLMRSLKAL